MKKHVMKEYKIKYWTGKRYPGGPAVFYYIMVEASCEETAVAVAKDDYIRRTGQANFSLHEVSEYTRPEGRVLSYGEA